MFASTTPLAFPACQALRKAAPALLFLPASLAPAMAIAGPAGGASATTAPAYRTATAPDGSAPDGAAPDRTADGPGGLTGGEQTVLVIGRSERPITVVPSGLAVSLGAEDFASVNAVNVEDLMKYAPNFFVRKRYTGDANGVPGFRGTHSTQSARTLVMVDGFVVSNFLGNSFGFAPKWGVAGPGEVRQFDIVYGPYSARYSGHSMGGIVSITTRSPQDGEVRAAAQLFTQAYRQYATEATYPGSSAEIAAGFQPRGTPLSVRIGYRRFSATGQPQSWFQLTPAAGTGGVAVTGAVVDPALIVPTPIFAAEAAPQTDQDQLRLRADLPLPGGWEAGALVLGWRSVFDTTRPQSYLRDPAGEPVLAGRVMADGRSWTLPAVNLALSDRVELLAGLRLSGRAAGWTTTVNLSRYAIVRHETVASAGWPNGLAGGGGTVTRQRATGWTTLDVVAGRDSGPVSLAVGLQASHYRMAQDIFTTTAWRSAAGRVPATLTQGATRLLGGFAEVRWDAGERLTLTGGLRGERWEAGDASLAAPVSGQLLRQAYAPRSDTALSPKASVSWDLAPDWTAQLSLAAATRFPTVGELYQARLDSSGALDPGSYDPLLRPEVSRDANLLLRRTLPAGRVTGSLFWQEVDDTIFSLQAFNQFGAITTAFRNIDRVRQWGLELIYEGSDVLVDGLSVDANVALIDAATVRNRALPASEGVQFPRIPRWRANGTVRYRFAERWMVSAGVRYASRPNTNLTGTQRGDTFGYASEQLIVDVRATLDLSGQLQLAAGIDNLNNDRAWAFHPFPQRTLLIELRWSR